MDSSNQDKDFALACKRRVVQFIYRWVTTIRQPVFEDESAMEFIEELAVHLENDCIHFSALQEEASLMHHVLSQLRRYCISLFLLHLLLIVGTITSANSDLVNSILIFKAKSGREKLLNVIIFNNTVNHNF